MRFIQRFAYKNAHNISESLNQSHKMKYKYYFGLQAIYNQLAEFIIILVVAMLFNVLFEVFVISLVFALLRFFVGGLHLSSLTLCTIFTVFLNNLAGILAKTIGPSTLWLLTSFGIIVVSIIAWAPRTEDIHKKTKRKIQGLAVSWIIFTVALLADGMFTISAAFGFILIAFTVSPFALILTPIDKKLRRWIK